MAEEEVGCWDVKKTGSCPRGGAPACKWCAGTGIPGTRPAGLVRLGNGVAPTSFARPMMTPGFARPGFGLPVGASLMGRPVGFMANGIAKQAAPAMPSEEKLQEAARVSRKLKRLLRETNEEADGLATGKRRKKEDGDIIGENEVEDEDDYKDMDDEEDEDGLDSEDREQRKAAMDEMIKKWNLSGTPSEYATRFVMKGLTTEELQKVAASPWRPEKFSIKHTTSEQLNMHIIQLRESKMQLGPRDPVDAFVAKWSISKEDAAEIRKLSYEVLIRVIDAYDGTITIEEEIAGATEAVRSEGIEDEEDDGGNGEVGEDGEPIKKVAASDKPKGWEVLSRFSKLELIPPDADALVCGDANLTFSLLLAKHRKYLGHQGIIVATTFEDLPTLQQRYATILHTIEQLKELGAIVLHEVDCTRLSVDEKFDEYRDEGRKFGAAYYNFPHAGAVRGFFDGQPFVNWRHLNLMTLYFRALRSICRPNAQVRVSSNARATGVRAAGIINAAEGSEFVHSETVPFPEWILQRYGRAYGDRRDAQRGNLGAGENYRAQGASADMVYTFWFTPTMDTSDLAPAAIRLPPDFKTLYMSCDACKCGLLTEAENRQLRYAKDAHATHFTSGGHAQLDGDAKHKQVMELFKRFASEVSGIHIG